MIVAKQPMDWRCLCSFVLVIKRSWGGGPSFFDFRTNLASRVTAACYQ
jgi:hypothetical protein